MSRLRFVDMCDQIRRISEMFDHEFQKSMRSTRPPIFGSESRPEPSHADPGSTTFITEQEPPAVHTVPHSVEVRSKRDSSGTRSHHDARRRLQRSDMCGHGITRHNDRADPKSTTQKKCQLSWILDESRQACQADPDSLKSIDIQFIRNRFDGSNDP